jgi:hypothetical protein
MAAFARKPGAGSRRRSRGRLVRFLGAGRYRNIGVEHVLADKAQDIARRIFAKLKTRKGVAALAIIVILLAALALAEPLPVPKPTGPGGSCPHGYTTSGSFCTPSASAQDAIALASAFRPVAINLYNWRTLTRKKRC